MEYLDQYAHMDSAVHRIPAPTKLAIAMVLIFLCLLFPVSWTWFFWGMAILLLVAAISSHVPLGFLVRRLLWLELVIVGMAASRLFGENGLDAFVSLVVHATACAAVMLMVSCTTRFTDILSTLTQLGLPSLLVTTLGLMYRYLFVLSDEAGRMKRARLARTFQRDRGRLWRSLASVIAQLFVRSAERAQRIHSAMLARGWQ
jgi:cobalt/nickel transport system permease protein